MYHQKSFDKHIYTSISTTTIKKQSISIISKGSPVPLPSQFHILILAENKLFSITTD